MGYSCKTSLIKFVISFCSYKAECACMPCLTICSTYFTSLSKELVDRTFTGGFKIALLVNIKTKSNQLADL